MKACQGVFERHEKKYLLTEQQFRMLSPTLAQYMCGDTYMQSTICNLYFDTPDFQLIRASIERPVYKEKLRLRCYDVPVQDTPAFAEIKKKCKRQVYKRRVRMPYGEAYAFLKHGTPPTQETQITKEIRYMQQLYGQLVPAMVLSYNRLALRGKQEPGLRITFDDTLLWRTEALDLRRGIWGNSLLPPGVRILEIKTLNAMPLWLAGALSQLAIYPASYSKYGNAYKQLVLCNPTQTGGIDCA